MLTRTEAFALLTSEGQPYELTLTNDGARGFKNTPGSLRVLFERARCEREFIVYAQERMTFEDVWAEASAFASELIASFGVANGDRVVIAMRNYPEWMVAFVAITSIGAVAVAANAHWRGDELRFALNDCGAHVLVADHERIARLCADQAFPQSVSVIGVRVQAGQAGALTTYEEIMARRRGDIMPSQQIDLDDVATILYTSGSTRRPKGVVSTHRNILSALLSWELDGAAAALTKGTPAVAPMQAAALLTIPLFHVSGLHSIFLASFSQHRRVVMMDKWDAAHAIELIRRECITHFLAPSTVTGDLVVQANAQAKALDSLAVVGGGGSHRPPEQVRGIAAAFANAEPCTGWGMTETNAIGVSISGKEYLDRPHAAGRASAIIDVCIRAESGALLGPHQSGELCVKGVSLMRGYWNLPEENAAAFVDGWFRTGDVAYVDDDGFVFITDRLKDIIVRGGENMSCAAIEAVLLANPLVREAAVFGVPDDRLGEVVAATVYALSDIDHDELVAWSRRHLAPHQVPQHLEVSRDALPRLASGKIHKAEIRKAAIRRLQPRSTTNDA